MHIEQITDSNKLLESIHIKNEKVSAKIYPNLGGSLQELTINGLRIVDGISHDSEGLIDYESSYKSSILFPFPNRIEDGAYDYQGQSHQFPVNEKPLNNALHGLVYNKQFDLISAEANEDAATVVLSYASKGEEPGFPFPFELTLSYQISKEGDLVLTFDVENSGDTSFPVGMGWHPYFAVNNLGNCQLSFPSRDFYQCNNRNLPIQTIKSGLSKSFKMDDKTFDDAYSLDQATCQFSADQYTLELNFEHSEDTYLQVYTPPHRKNIAIEPMTTIANSFNNKIGFKELFPGEKDHWTIQLSVSLF